MASYQNEKYNRYLARYTKKKAQLTAAEELLDELMKVDADEYRFDDGIGSQRVRKRKLKEAKKLQDDLEAEVDWIWNKLNGFGLVNLRLRR